VNSRRVEAAGAALVAAIGLLAFAPGRADAAIEVGETFTPSGGAAACGGDRTWLQYPAPSDGVITAWRFQADGAPPQLKFKLGRATATPNQFTIIGESDLKTPVAGQLNTYPIRLPVLAGDLIGFYTATMGDCLRGGGSPPTLFARLGEATVNSSTTFTPSSGLQLDVSVLLEPTPETSITRHPKGKTRKRKTRFAFTSSEPGSTFECSLDGKPFAPCASPDIFKVKRGKHRFAVRARGPAGNADPTPASDRWRVTKKRAKAKL
jgi:hypothetical protein